MGSLFSNKQSTKSSSQQSGTTQSNLWDDPNLQSFLSQYTNQYGNLSGFNVPVNQYQTQAPGQQAGVAGQLQPGFNTAATVAGQGITPASIQSFMSPYTQNVVDATRADFATQNARDLSNASAQAAKMGALTGTQGAVTRNLTRESQRRTQDPIIAGLYNQGYNQAANTAAQSAGLQLQGAGTLGSLGNAATAANTGLGNLGQSLWNAQYQNAITPYSLYNQGVQGFQGLGNLSGTTSTGQSTGTSTTTTTPSTGSVIAGLIGTGLSFFADGGAVSGEPQKKEDFADKVASAYKAFDAMRRHARGGEVRGYDLGGDVPFAPWNQPSPIGTEDDQGVTPAANWTPVVTKEPQGPSMAKKFGSGLSSFSSNLGPKPEDGRANQEALNREQSHLSSFMDSMRRNYDAGGEVVPTWNDDRPVFAAPEATMSGLGARNSYPEVLGSLSTYLPKPLSTGIWANQVATPAQRIGMALTQIGNGPFAGFGRAMTEVQAQRLREMEAERAAGALLGKFRGQPTMDAQRLAIEREKLPAEIEAIEARSIDSQKELREFDTKLQRDLASLEHLRKTESDIDTAVMYGAITPEEGETRRQQARQLYQQQRGMIKDATTPPAPQPTQPPGSVRKWTPDKGLQ